MYTLPLKKLFGYGIVYLRKCSNLMDTYINNYLEGIYFLSK